MWCGRGTKSHFPSSPISLRLRLRHSSKCSSDCGGKLTSDEPQHDSRSHGHGVCDKPLPPRRRRFAVSVHPASVQCRSSSSS